MPFLLVVVGWILCAHLLQIACIGPPPAQASRASCTMPRCDDNSGMAFVQPPPRLVNQYDDDRVLRSYLHRDAAAGAPPRSSRVCTTWAQLRGRRALQAAACRAANRAAAHPVGRVGQPRRPHRGDAAVAAAPSASPPSVVSSRSPTSATHGAFARVHQFALVYLFTPSTDLYSCPLAMTDGAARALLASGNQALIDRAVPRLTSRDPSGSGRAGSG